MFCKNLVKKLNGKLRCKVIKQEVTLDWCDKCNNKEYKTNKPIKKKSSHKRVVSDETYHLVLDRDIICQMADKNCKGKLELHHIRYRSEAVDLIDDPNNCIMLCSYHHQLAHSNKKKYQPMLLGMVERRINGRS